MELTSDNLSLGYYARDTQPGSISEVWVQIPGWPYEVSNLGRVRRVGKGLGAKPGRILPSRLAGKYPIVTLSNHQKHWSIQVHLLVAHAFLGPTPVGMEVNHIDNKKLNPALTNLEFKTPSANILQSVANGHRGENRWNATLTEHKVCQIKEMHKNGTKGNEIASVLAISRSAVFHVLAGRNWKHVT